MEYVANISKYNSLIHEERAYIFLDRLYDQLVKIRSDVLQLKPFRTMEEAYIYVRREKSRQLVMLTRRDDKINSTMTSKRVKDGPIILSKIKVLIEKDSCTYHSKIGHTQDMCFKVRSVQLGGRNGKDKIEKLLDIILHIRMKTLGK